MADKRELDLTSTHSLEGAAEWIRKRMIERVIRGETIRWDPGAVMGTEMIDLPDFPYVYFWNRMGRKGQFCRVIARGKMNSCQVEFEDGFQAITSRNALRKRHG